MFGNVPWICGHEGSLGLGMIAIEEVLFELGKGNDTGPVFEVARGDKLASQLGFAVATGAATITCFGGYGREQGGASKDGRGF